MKERNKRWYAFEKERVCECESVKQRERERERESVEESSIRQLLYALTS